MAIKWRLEMARTLGLQRNSLIRLSKYTILGWKELGAYVRKWFLYNIYALAIYLAFAGFIGIALSVGILGSVIHDIVGVLFGGLTLIFLPAVLGYHRQSKE